MHRYGGAFHDVKRENHNFRPYFEQLRKHPTAWVNGYSETNRGAIGCAKENARRLGVNCEWVKDKWRTVVGNGMAVFRAGTPLTKTWMELVHDRLDEVLETLRAHPAPFARCCFHNEGGYPLSWNELKGGTLHPLEAYYDLRGGGRALRGLPFIDMSSYHSATEDK
jgi:hypothetical protein